MRGDAWGQPGAAHGLALKRVTLLLCSRCNLACDYCYQGKRTGPESMSWEVARRSLDLLLDGGAPRPAVEFSGGEPLLELELLERCVAYALSRAGSRPVRFVLTTNGTLLDSRTASSLARHGVRLHVSMDGDEPAQRRRGSQTLPRLEEALALLARDHPGYYRTRVEVHACLASETVGTLARSCRFFLDRDVPDVRYYPVIGHAGPPSEALLDELLDQVDQVVRDSASHWAGTGRVPVAFLRGKAAGLAPSHEGEPCCSAGTTAGMAVDTSGRAWTCVLFANSLQPLSGMASEASEALGAGDVLAPDFPLEFRKVPARAARVALLTDRRAKHSSFRACRDCDLLSECFYCPAATGHIPGNTDPHLVSWFDCLFNRAVAHARHSFRVAAGGRPPCAVSGGQPFGLGSLLEVLRRRAR